MGAARWLSQASPSLGAAPTGCAANGNWNPQPGAVLLPHGGRGSDKKPGLLSLCTPSWQDNSHPVWFCGLRSFLFFHLLLTQKAGLGSRKRSDKQKWSWSQGSGRFYSALTKTLHWLQLWLVRLMHAWDNKIQIWSELSQRLGMCRSRSLVMDLSINSL